MWLGMMVETVLACTMVEGCEYLNFILVLINVMDSLKNVVGSFIHSLFQISLLYDCPT